jgi:hypothetical protein
LHEPLKTGEKKDFTSTEHKEYLHPFIYDSDIETIPGEYLEEYRKLEPPNKMKGAFSRFVYNCPYCKKPQYSNENLKKHILEVHNKPIYKCSTCGYKSARSGDISKHKKKHK